MSGFEAVDRALRTSLVEARLQLHYAAQLAAGAAAALVRPEEDDSHTSFAILEAGALFAGRPTETPAPVRVCLDVPGLSLRLTDESLIPITSFPLVGRSLADGFSWLSDELVKCTGDAFAVPVPKLGVPDYVLPRHPLQTGARFEGSGPSALVELSRWFGNAALVLESVRRDHPAASPVLLWPHHFDVATLVRLDAERSINVGLSPGDDYYAEPYWYVSPWPHPENASDEKLDAGHWHTSEFVAAILLGGVERENVESFVASALAACRRLLGGSPP